MRKFYFAVVAAVMLVSGPASAQLAGVVGDVSPDTAEVLLQVAPRPEPVVYPVNSAIVLTNPHSRPTGFKIELYDHEGNVAGGGSRIVGPRALEVIWVSTLLEAQGEPFVGWGMAKSERPLQCNAFLAGIGVSPLPVESSSARLSTANTTRRKLFSVLAAF